MVIDILSTISFTYFSRSSLTTFNICNNQFSSLENSNELTGFLADRKVIHEHIICSQYLSDERWGFLLCPCMKVVNGLFQSKTKTNRFITAYIHKLHYQIFICYIYIKQCRPPLDLCGDYSKHTHNLPCVAVKSVRCDLLRLFIPHTHTQTNARAHTCTYARTHTHTQYLYI